MESVKQPEKFFYQIKPHDTMIADEAFTIKYDQMVETEKQEIEDIEKN